jgi:GNAT superfamily N-acetyltransferase
MQNSEYGCGMSERAGVAAGTSLASLIGKRVSIRLKDGDGYRDIVGILQDQNSLINRHGEKIDFNEEEISIWREVVTPPDRAGTGAPLSIRVMELELLSNKTWPAPAKVQRAGWLYRSAHGVSFRANSVLPHGKAPYGEPLSDLDNEIDFCINYYRNLGLKPTIAVPLPIYQELDSKLESEGWRAEIKANFLVKDLLTQEFILNPEIKLLVESNPSAEWIALQGDGAIQEIMSAYPASYLSLLFENKIVGTARIAIDDRWAIVTRLFIKEEFRGKGLSKLIMASASNLAIELGATKICLQVDSSNLVALGLYQGLGYKIHHSYNYRTLA